MKDHFWIPAPDRGFFFLPLRTRAAFWGWVHGRRDIPGPDDRRMVIGPKGFEVSEPTFTPFEMALKEKTDCAIRNGTRAWHSIDRPLLQEYCRLRTEREALTRRMADDEEAIGRLADEKKTADESWKPFGQQLRMGQRVYIPLMILLGILEFPMNAQVFQIFGERTQMTYLFAGFLALVLPAGAHFLGLLLKHGGYRREGGRPDAILLTLSVAFPVALIVAVAYLRAKFLEGSGVSKALGIEMSPSALTAIFVTFNLFVFLVASLAAYFAHDWGFGYAETNLRNANRSLAEMRKNLALLKDRREKVDEELAKLGAKRQKTYDEFQIQAQGTKDYMQILIEVYRNYNLLGRARAAGTAASRPKSFEEYPPLNTNAQMPATLTWDCDHPDPKPAASLSPGEPRIT